MSDTILNHNALVHRLVLNRQTSEKVGHLKGLLLDPPSQKIVGFHCNGGLLGKPRQVFYWEQIESIGEDSILVRENGWENHNEQGSWGDLKNSEMTPIAAPINHEVWTDQGKQIGQIIDLHFDINTGKICDYLFTAGSWKGLLEGTYRLPPVAVSSIGSQRIIILEKMMNHICQDSEGLGQKANHILTFLEEDYRQTKQDLTSISETVQSTVEKVKQVLEIFIFYAEIA